MTDAPKRDWKKIVEESNGKLSMLPEQFTERAKEWNANRLKLSELANAAAKHELQTRMSLELLVKDIRDYLDENGMKEVYLKDVGFETGALNDGLFVISVTEQR